VRSAGQQDWRFSWSSPVSQENVISQLNIFTIPCCWDWQHASNSIVLMFRKNLMLQTSNYVASVIFMDKTIRTSDTARRPDWNDGVLRPTSDVVFVKERTLRGLVEHVANSSRKYHSPDFVGKCAVQWTGHQGHHTTRWQKSDIYIYFQLFYVHYHDRMNGSESLVCLTPSGVTRASSVNKMLRIIWG